MIERKKTNIASATPKKATRLFYQRPTVTSPKQVGGSQSVDSPSKRKDPSQMTEEEKVQWKIRVFADCEDTDYKVQENLKMV